MNKKEKMSREERDEANEFEQLQENAAKEEREEELKLSLAEKNSGLWNTWE